MGSPVVVDLTEHRERRRAASAALAMQARMHPALRWLTGDATDAAHRRTPMGRAKCGAHGELTLAPRETPLCGTCYPRQGSE